MLVVFLFLFMLIFMLDIVGAQLPFDIRGPINEGIQIFRDVFGPFFEAVLGVSQFDANFFALVLLLVLLFVVIYALLIRINTIMHVSLFENRAVAFLVALIVSVLSVRFLPTDWVGAILLPYGGMGISIAVLLPLIIFGLFVHFTLQSGSARRMAWLFFAIVFVGLWIKRRAEVGDFGWIYGVGIAMVLVNILFDRQIHRYFGRMQTAQAMRVLDDKSKVDIFNRFIAAKRAWEESGRKYEPARRQMLTLAKQLKIDPSRSYY